MYLEPSRTSGMELPAKIINGLRIMAVFTEIFVSDSCLGSLSMHLPHLWRRFLNYFVSVSLQQQLLFKVTDRLINNNCWYQLISFPGIFTNDFQQGTVIIKKVNLNSELIVNSYSLFINMPLYHYASSVSCCYITGINCF